MKVRCCIAGGGPACMMLGYLLDAPASCRGAEKHDDFFRDFRGEPCIPRHWEVMGELGLIDAFLKVPHQKIEKLNGVIGDAGAARRLRHSISILSSP